jgi:predicted transcriptional regulator
MTVAEAAGQAARSEPVSDDERKADVDDQWRTSLLEMMRQVVNTLPDETTLGDLVRATRGNAQFAPLLAYISVQELIDMAVARPPTVKPSGRKTARSEPEVTFDEEGNPIMDLPDTGPAVIRRRADVPDGDSRVLRLLADEGPLTETSLARTSRLTQEQLRLVLRHLRTKGWIHIEGSGTKRKIKITRNGASHIRKGGTRKVV